MYSYLVYNSKYLDTGAVEAYFAIVSYKTVLLEEYLLHNLIIAIVYRARTCASLHSLARGD